MDDASDLVHDIFSRLIGRGYDPGKIDRTFLYRCVLNGISDHFRRASASAGALSLLEQEIAPIVESLDDDSADDRLHWLRNSIKTLSPNQQRTLLLWAEGYSHASIAKALGIKRETVRTHLYRARSKLRELACFESQTLLV